MASLTQDKKTQIWRIHFRYGKPKRQFQKSLETTDKRKAEGMKAAIEETLHDIKRGRAVVPPDADLWVFIRSSGKLNQEPTAPKAHTLGDLFREYFARVTPGAKEANTLRTEGFHREHLLGILGASKALTALKADDVQSYVNERAKQKWRGKTVGPETIRKEVATLRMVWNRADMLLGQALPPLFGRKVDFPKGKEKQSFRTWDEIESAIERGRLGKEEQKELWDCLFLDVEQVKEVLDYALIKKTRSAYIYPLLVFAAHTGARLSEILRSRVEDLKFKEGEVLISEYKKSKDSVTYRRIPMSERFVEVMTAYFRRGHPGGTVTISREADKPLLDSTAHAAHDWFFAGSKWSVLRGYHVFRHSFASNLARNGEDQRVIDELMGHETEEMRKRYRHLFPEQRVNAVKKLFG